MMNLYRRVLALVGAVALGSAALAQSGEQSNGFKSKVPVGDIASSVVTIEYRIPRAFDTYPPATGRSATGFVVDAEKGILMTNRHVVLPGPVVARGVFYNGEELALSPIYRDPVHDFGFFRFDPKALEFAQVKALPLYPEGAKVGARIRVVGNDNSRKLLVQDGEISRLDHNAPMIGGRLGYQDWNTFYVVASTGSSGGSSGSPVVDDEGRVVALMSAANSRSLTAFFLPLQRAKRALDALQAGKAVVRGTLQTVFRHQPYNELRRIGLDLTKEREARAQHPEASGLLTVSQVLPQGPADEVLQAGDILVSIAGQPVADFVALEAALDDNIEKSILLRWIRDGAVMDAQVTVQDLDSITPAEFLEIGGDIVHTMSYQVARHNAIAARGVFVADPHYALLRGGIPRGAVITEIAEQPVPDLDTFERVWASLPHGERVGFRYFMPDSPGTTRVHVVRVERQWFAPRRCARNDAERFWSCKAIAKAPTDTEAINVAAQQNMTAGGSHRQPLQEALVKVEFTTPYGTNGMLPGASSGIGFVIDAERGLVVVTRTAVNTSLGDAELTFLARKRISANVLWLDPKYGFAVLQYDPEKLAGLPVRELPMTPTPMKAGDTVQVVGLVNSGQLLGRKTQIQRMVPLELPLPHPPQFYARDIDVMTLLEPPTHIKGGVVLSQSGKVVALWGGLHLYNHGKRQMRSLQVGIPVRPIQSTLAMLRAGGEMLSQDWGFELRRVTLRYAQDLGVPEEWLVRLGEAGQHRPGALQIRRRSSEHPAKDVLEDGDVVLSINGVTPSIFDQAYDALGQKPCADVDVFRRGKLLKVSVCAKPTGDQSRQRVFWWNGLALHDPHRALSVRRGEPARGVYVSSQSKGSPAKVGLASNLITEVNGNETPDLEAFKQAIVGIKAGDLVRVKVRTLSGNEARHGFYHDVSYWPAQEFVRRGAEWSREAVQ